MSRISRTAATAVLTATAALAAGTGTAHAGVPCFANLPGPGDAWEIQNDGSMEISFNASGGSALDQDHGRLVVSGVAYPKLPNADAACSTTSSSITFPARTLGNGLEVRRSVSVSGGRVRWLDSIRNPSAQQKSASVDFGLEVLGSQLIATTESGDDEATDADHWTVHSSNGKLFPFLQWGQGSGAIDPVVIPEDLGDSWADDFGTMSDDATLRYANVPVPPGSTVRLLHVAGATTALATSTDAAKDTAGPFAGYSKAFAKDVVNWGPDPDGDGVVKTADDCPSLKGDLANGCPQLIGQPPEPTDPVEPGTPDPGTPGSPSPTDPGTTPPPVVTDTTGPGITLKGLGTRVRRTTLTTGKGLGPRFACTEDCRLKVSVRTRKRGRTSDATIATVQRTAFSTATRTVRIKVKAASLRRLARQRVVLVIRATDRAGNATVVRRVVTLR